MTEITLITVPIEVVVLILLPYFAATIATIVYVNAKGKGKSSKNNDSQLQQQQRHNRRITEIYYFYL